MPTEKGIEMNNKNKNQDKPEFRYSDEQEDGSINKKGINPKYAIYTLGGKEYRVLMRDIYAIAKIYGLPYQIQEEVRFWAKMIHNPD